MRESIFGILSVLGLFETQERFSRHARAGVITLTGKVPTEVTLTAKATRAGSKDSLSAVISYLLPSQVDAPKVSVLRRVISIFHARYLAKDFSTHRAVWQDSVR